MWQKSKDLLINWPQLSEKSTGNKCCSKTRPMSFEGFWNKLFGFFLRGLVNPSYTKTSLHRLSLWFFFFKGRPSCLVFLVFVFPSPPSINATKNTCRSWRTVTHSIWTRQSCCCHTGFLLSSLIFLLYLTGDISDSSTVWIRPLDSVACIDSP